MIIPIIQIVVGLALVVVILLQQQSSGLGGAFGGGGGEFFHTKRGAEKLLFNSTVALAIIFFALALANLTGLF